MNISTKTFGVLATGQKTRLYTLTAGDLSLSISTLGAAWTALTVPSRKTGAEDVLLGFPTLAGYAGANPFFGATVGRFANRIGGAAFTLGGKRYALARNDGEHSLHGGRVGFDKRVWAAEAYEERGGVFVRFELDSPDGEEGYPGRLRAAVTYGLTPANEISVDYAATVDAPCPVNFTNHSYFNLAGAGKGDVLSHEVALNAASYLEVDAGLIPTGKLLPVAGGPFDFRARKVVKRDIAAAGGGYDHCFVVDGEPGVLRPCAEVTEATSGRRMRMLTTQPGIQFYTGNMLPDLVGKLGAAYHKHSGFCLETQHFPDAPNQERFPSALYRAGEPFASTTAYRFSTR